MEEISIGIDDLISELIRRNHACVEREVRNYIRAHRTTRLDIELAFHQGSPFIAEDDGFIFFRSNKRDSFEVRICSEFEIRQKQFCGWRAPLPD